nr:hypothetical protein [uncultured Selenomonas sp.]
MDRMEIRGRCGTAIVYAKVIEDEAVEQIRRMCDYEFTEGASIRIMPDVHWARAVKENLSMDEFRKTMAGVYTTAANENTLDEAPMAYKALLDIIDVIGDSVDVVEVLKPIYNFKAG